MPSFLYSPILTPTHDRNVLVKHTSIISERSPLKQTSTWAGSWLQHLPMELVSGSPGVQTLSCVHPCLVPVAFCCCIFFFNGQIITYSIGLVSATHPYESAIGIHMPPPSWTSLPSPTPSHPSRFSQSTKFELPASYSKIPLAIYFTCIWVSSNEVDEPRAHYTEWSKSEREEQR